MWQLRDIGSDRVLCAFREHDTINIGSSAECQVVTDAPGVAPVHCTLRATPTGIQIEADRPVTLNNAPPQLPCGLRPGDTLGLGELSVAVQLDPGATLIRDLRDFELEGVSTEVSDVVVPLADTVIVIGRDEDCDVVLAAGHVSRQHAHLERAADGIWLTDLNSRNGTFVDGERISGARRLSGGEQLCFDQTQFVLAVRQPPAPEPEPEPEPVDPNATLIRSPTTVAREPPAGAAATAATVVEVTPAAAASADPAIAATIQMERPVQPVLVGNSAPIHGQAFVLRPGQFVIGRGVDCDIVLPESSVSSRHARIMIRPDEYTVMNLISSNGIFVNGERVVSKQLSTGDVISLGRIELVFAEDAAAAERIVKALRIPAPLPNWAYTLAAFAGTIGLIGASLAAARHFGW